MAWQCYRCNHFTASGQKHHCINDEVEALRNALKAAQAVFDQM